MTGTQIHYVWKNIDVIFMFAMASWQVYLIFSSNLAESTLCGALFVEVSHGQKLDWITVTRELGDGHQSIVIGIDIPNMFGFPLWDGWPKLIYHVLTMVHMESKSGWQPCNDMMDMMGFLIQCQLSTSTCGESLSIDIFKTK